MATKSFRDLMVWKCASDLTVEVYKIFGNSRDFAFRDQIQKASISIMNNIAEGYARRSDRSFSHFLSIAKGSAAEVESMIIIAERLGYVSKPRSEDLMLRVEEIGRMLTGFIKKLSAKDY